jgi:hypothetical protein
MPASAGFEDTAKWMSCAADEEAGRRLCQRLRRCQLTSCCGGLLTTFGQLQLARKTREEVRVFWKFQGSDTHNDAIHNDDSESNLVGFFKLFPSSLLALCGTCYFFC